MAPAIFARNATRGTRQRGATLVEFVIVVPTLLFMLMNLIQYGLLYHAKSQVNYATYEAARAGTVKNADPDVMRKTFLYAMTGYYGGGDTSAELAQSYARAVADTAALRIEVISPSKESFDDFYSPELAGKLGHSGRVIPNSNLAFISCPIDRPSCAKDPKSNQSGQTLLDANLLKIRITWGIPIRKQVPLAGRFMSWALKFLNPGDTDTFRAGLVAAHRIPVVAHVVMRMQSPAFENGNLSSPGPGNDGAPVDPGPPPDGPGLPKCPVTDPTCTEGPVDDDDDDDGVCDPATDPSGCLPPGCQQGDPNCDPGCGTNYCCVPSPA